jgi:hypothetical protein
MKIRIAAIIMAAWAYVLPAPVMAQQRPLVTEDAEPIGAGRVLVEGGLEFGTRQEYPVYGLRGDLWRGPLVGVSVGISSIAEFQIDGGFYNHLSIERRRTAPLSHLLDIEGDSTSDVEDFVVATKIRVLAEQARRPAIGVRFATKLPNAGNDSGLGLDTTDFYMALLGAKTVQSFRVVGNLGVGILGDPTDATGQDEVLTYGFSLARAVTNQVEVVGEFNGRVSNRDDDIPSGTETRGRVNFGGRYTRGALRFDGNVFFGLTGIDPTIGFGAGFTYVFNAFQIP